MRGIIRLPGILFQIMAATMQGIRQIVISGVNGIVASVRAIITLQNPLEAFQEQFSGAFGRAFEAAASAFEEDNAFTRLSDSVQFSDALLRLYGLDDEGIANLRRGLRNAGQRTLDEFRKLFSVDIPAETAAAAQGIADGIEMGTMQAEESVARLSGSVETIARAFSRFAIGVIDDFRGIGSAVSNLAKTIRDELLTVLLLRPLTTQLASFVAGNIGLPTTVTPRQRGGFTPPGLTLLGEGGPELVDFRRPGQVYSTSQLAAALRESQGGQGINLTVNIAPGVNSAQVSQAIAESYPHLRDAITAHVERARSRRRS